MQTLDELENMLSALRELPKGWVLYSIDNTIPGRAHVILRRHPKYGAEDRRSYYAHGNASSVNEAMFNAITNTKIAEPMPA